MLVISVAAISESNGHILKSFLTRPPPAKYQFNKKALLFTPNKGESNQPTPLAAHDALTFSFCGSFAFRRPADNSTAT